tara:strand:- start:637 stop:1140 length:504 start_codon:yes stop_codon:yes gene_type:complete
MANKVKSQILVVDDEPELVKAVAKSLKFDSYDVEGASDVETALELCKAHLFDLVIVDFKMPSMTGIELINEIRKELPFTKSILISGFIDTELSETEVKEDLLSNIEADAYLHKPVTNEKLREAVHRLLNGPKLENWQKFAAKKVGAVKNKNSVKEDEYKMKNNTRKK